MRSISVANRNVSNSCYQLRSSLTADFIALLITQLIRSTCPFAWDHNGIVLLWVIPLILRNYSISLDVDCPPLLLLSVFGKPCTEKILNNLEKMVAEVVLFKISTMEIENSSPLELVKFLQLEMDLINIQLLITMVTLALELASLQQVGDDPTLLGTSDIPK